MTCSRIHTMSKIISISTPDDWTCLNILLDKLPRSVDKSAAVRMAVEKFLEITANKPTISLDNFETETTTPDLNSEPKVWKELTKKMETSELRELAKLMTKRKSIVEEEVFKRTL